MPRFHIMLTQTGDLLEWENLISVPKIAEIPSQIVPQTTLVNSRMKKKINNKKSNELLELRQR